MATLTIFKYFYTFISYFCYFGTGIIAFDQLIADSAIREVFNVNPAAQQIILALLIIFWIVKIYWKIMDKRLEHRERKLKMASDQDELDDRRARRARQ